MKGRPRPNRLRYIKWLNSDPEIAHTIAKRLGDRGWNHLGERQEIGPEKIEEFFSYRLLPENPTRIYARPIARQ